MYITLIVLSFKIKDNDRHTVYDILIFNIFRIALKAQETSI